MVQRAAVRLGERFVREVDQAIVRILENPLAFPVILRRHEVRRVGSCSASRRLIARSSANVPWRVPKYHCGQTRAAYYRTIQQFLAWALAMPRDETARFLDVQPANELDEILMKTKRILRSLSPPWEPWEQS
jgi:hypothetical protein